MTPAPLMSAEDLANYLQVPVDTVMTWNTHGTGPRRYRVGRHVRYRPADVEEWLQQQLVPDNA